MCGRYTVTASAREIAQTFGAEMDADLELRPRYNLAPTQMAPVVVATDGARRVELRRWGLIPSWAKDPKIGNRMINARSERVATAPAFRAAFRSRRCLVPASGFYEWAPGKPKRPHYIHARDAGLLAFAGLHETWRPEGAEPVATFTILTTDANALMARLHDRMPLILPRDAWSTWLAAGTDADRVRSLLHPADEEVLAEHPVGAAVNSPRFDSPECIVAVAEAP